MAGGSEGRSGVPRSGCHGPMPAWRPAAHPCVALDLGRRRGGFASRETEWAAGGQLGLTPVLASPADRVSLTSRRLRERCRALAAAAGAGNSEGHDAPAGPPGAQRPDGRGGRRARRHGGRSEAQAGGGASRGACGGRPPAAAAAAPVHPSPRPFRRPPLSQSHALPSLRTPRSVVRACRRSTRCCCTAAAS